MEERLIKRGETSGRVDDNAETIRKRFSTFVEETIPVIESYEEENKVKRVRRMIASNLSYFALFFLLDSPLLPCCSEGQLAETRQWSLSCYDKFHDDLEQCRNFPLFFIFDRWRGPLRQSIEAFEVLTPRPNDYYMKVLLVSCFLRAYFSHFKARKVNSETNYFLDI